MSRDSIDRFGFEMAAVTRVSRLHEWQFTRWIGPLTPADFRGKRVLDAGCGMGRNSYFALQYGASQVVAFDCDERTVATARATLADFPNAQVEFRNTYDIDYSDEFDLAMCIGVIEHLEHPEQAIDRLVRSLAPGGTLVVWVYGNDYKIALALVNTLRIVTSRLPPPVLWRLSYLFSIPVYGALKVTGGRSDYFRQLAASDLRHVHAIVFDQLLPVISRYYDRGSALKLIDRPDLTDTAIHHTNGNSWTLVAIKKPSPAGAL